MVSDEKAKNQPKAIYWDLPCAGLAGTDGSTDPFQWRNLSAPHGWLRISHYLAIGCISAREILAEPGKRQTEQVWRTACSGETSIGSIASSTTGAWRGCKVQQKWSAPGARTPSWLTPGSAV